MLQDTEPIEIFAKWFADAQETEHSYPNAMALSTVSQDGMPDVRIVLLKDFNQSGFSFFTNYDGKKAKDLDFNSKASICFYWKSLERQVRISGVVEKVPESASDAYFESRPRMSQIGAWASAQSQPMNGEHDLEIKVAEYSLKFHVDKVPRPPNWGGYLLKPVRIEFWEERPFRLHRRRVFSKTADRWSCKRIFP